MPLNPITYDRFATLVMATGLILLIGLAIALCIYFVLASGYSKVDNTMFYRNAAVATNSKICSEIAIHVLKNQGSAADATIAALLCEGVANPQSMGIGGGFLLTVYDRKRKIVEVLNGREVAPAASSKDLLSNAKAEMCGLTVAVPGEIMGYWELHQKYGKLPWYDLFKPTINLCREGIPVSQHLAKTIQKMDDKISLSPTMKHLFINPKTGDYYKMGDLMFRPHLANTLELIARKGPDVLYKGSLGKVLVDDITLNGGIMTMEDLKNYRAEWVQPISTSISENLTAYSTPLPGAGGTLFFILNVLSGFEKTDDPLTNWFRIVETWKYAFALRSRQQQMEKTISNSTGCLCLSDTDEDVINVRDRIENACRTSNDPEFYADVFHDAEDGGTAHISVLGPNGDAVAATSTINTFFGAMFASPSTGIIFNNQMLDFSTNHAKQPWKTTPFNFIEPNKHPLSSMCPTIVLDKNGDVRFITGAAGGFKIITTNSLILREHLLHGVDVRTAVENKRLHHQLLPMVLMYEAGFRKDVLQGLEDRGHKLLMLEDIRSFTEANYTLKVNSTATAISVEDGKIYAASDSRRDGFVCGF